MLATDAQNPEFVGATNPDSRLYVEFYTRPYQNEFLSIAQGRPIFEDVTFVKIQVPGDNTFNIDTPVQEHHKQRFPFHWQRFVNAHGDDNKLVGTPLSQWPRLTPSIVEELKYQKFVTVEQIAGASDAQLGKLGLSAGMAPFALREQAKRFLDVARGEADLTSRDEELKAMKAAQEQKDAEHAAEMAELKAELKALTEAITQKGKPGRKPAVQEVIDNG